MCIAMHDQTWKMIRQISLFALLSDNLAGFIIQSLLAILFYLLVYSFCMKYPYKGGIMSIRRVLK